MVFFSSFHNGGRHAALLMSALDVLMCVHGWRLWLALYCSGFLTTLALPPYYVIPAACVGVSFFFFRALSVAHYRDACVVGWWFGFGFFSTGLYWFAYPLLVDGDRFAWLIPFAVFGIGAGLALFYALAIVTLFACSKRFVLYQKFVLFAVVMGCVEWLRGHILTGFPWNLLGYVWTVSDVTIQVASYLGIYLLSAFTWMAMALPTYYVMVRRQSRSDAMLGRIHVGLLYGVVAVLVVLVGLGAARLHGAKTSFHKDIKLRVVQGNIPQSLKWKPEMRLEAVRNYAALSMMEGADSVTHIIWPETAMTFPFVSGDYWAKELSGILSGKQMLLTGVMRITKDGQGHDHYYNSLQALDASAQVQMSYDKIHLVPFGEYVPLRDWLPLEKITQGSVDMSSGMPQQSHQLVGLPSFRPIICYESIFPEMSYQVYPAWLLNITNDAWFGDSSAPYQLLQMSRVRAVENAVPLVRAANTGISAIVDGYGRVLQYLPLDVDGVIDGYLPNALENNSFYNLYGDWVWGVIAMGCGLCFIWNTHKK